jgi:hypothetical protein
MMVDRKTLLILAAGIAVGWFAFSGNGLPSPFQPAKDRPFLRFIAKAAKTFLWVAMFAEQPPQPAEQGRHLVHSPAVGEDGYPLVDHGQGW